MCARESRLVVQLGEVDSISGYFMSKLHPQHPCHSVKNHTHTHIKIKKEENTKETKESINSTDSHNYLYDNCKVLGHVVTKAFHLLV